MKNPDTKSKRYEDFENEVEEDEMVKDEIEEVKHPVEDVAPSESGSAVEEEEDDEAEPIRMSVEGCALLNVREKPKATAKVVTILKSKDIIRIDPVYTNEHYSKVVSPVKGYVMTKFLKKI